MSKQTTKGGGKSSKAMSAEVPPVTSKKSDQCRICTELVDDEDFGLECEVCEGWFHIKCQDMTKDEYTFLESHKSLHWYCNSCNSSIVNVIKLFSSLKTKVDDIDNKLNSICDGILPVKIEESIDNKIKVGVGEIEMKVNKLISEFQEIRDQVSIAETKLDTAIEAKLVTSMDSIKKNLEPTWASIVNKEVNTQFQRVSSDVTSVKTVLEDTQKMANEEREKESRSHNVIIYRVPEIDNQEQRIKDDRVFCLELFNEVVGVDAKEEDFKFYRLGKKDHGFRPLLIKFREKTTKNRVMESLYKLQNADSKFTNVSITHDMTLNEREECKTLVEEAKLKQSSETGEFIWRVRGLPGQLKLVKLRKN